MTIDLDPFDWDGVAALLAGFALILTIVGLWLAWRQQVREQRNAAAAAVRKSVVDFSASAVAVCRGIRDLTTTTSVSWRAAESFVAVASKTGSPAASILSRTRDLVRRPEAPLAVHWYLAWEASPLAVSLLARADSMLEQGGSLTGEFSFVPRTAELVDRIARDIRDNLWMTLNRDAALRTSIADALIAKTEAEIVSELARLIQNAQAAYIAKRYYRATELVDKLASASIRASRTLDDSAILEAVRADVSDVVKASDTLTAEMTMLAWRLGKRLPAGQATTLAQLAAAIGPLLEPVRIDDFVSSEERT